MTEDQCQFVSNVKRHHFSILAAAAVTGPPAGCSERIGGGWIGR